MTAAASARKHLRPKNGVARQAFALECRLDKKTGWILGKNSFARGANITRA